MVSDKRFHHRDRFLGNAGDINGGFAPGQTENAAFDWKACLISILSGIILFASTLAASADNSKVMTIIFLIAALAGSIVLFRRQRNRGLLYASVFFYVLICGISVFYGSSGKYAITEYLKVLIGYSLFLAVSLIEIKGVKKGKIAAVAFETAAGIAAFLSIDMISTGLVSGLFQRFMLNFNTGFEGISALEIGTRIYSIYQNPNVFSGIMGIAMLISLGLLLCSKSKREKFYHFAMLSVCSLAFVLSFSLGAFIMFVPSVVVYLFIEKKDRRADAFVIIAETAVIVFLMAACVYMAVFGGAKGSFVPVGVLVLGWIAVSVFDCFIRCKIASAMNKNMKLFYSIVASVVAVILVFAGVAWLWTGDAYLNQGDVLSRCAYMNGGTYILRIDSEYPCSVVIESQNKKELVMHTNTVLYRGNAQDVEFSVPEDSRVVRFNITSLNDGNVIREAEYRNAEGSKKLPLNYKLLPGFVANRLQGLFANQNAAQRIEFFKDGLKIYLKSPITGNGMGAFQNWIQSTQRFYYETKYSHNHYIEMLLQAGILGIVSFVGMLFAGFYCIVKAVRNKNKEKGYEPVLFAALLFTALHAIIEVNFSMNFYIPFAFWLFGLINVCCGDEIEINGGAAVDVLSKTVVIAWLAAWIVMLGGNMYAKSLAYAKTQTVGEKLVLFQRAADMDLFEGTDYMLSYMNVVMTNRGKVPEGIVQIADEYAHRIGRCDSRTIAVYAAGYYFSGGDIEKGFEQLNKYVMLGRSSQDIWIRAFDIIESNVFYMMSDYELFCRKTEELYDRFTEANGYSLDDMKLSEKNLKFLSSVI